MKEKISIISVLANVALASGKISFGFISNSSAVLAEGIHSFMDIFSSIISYLGIKISQKSDNEKYPYGRYKFEVLGGALITLILFLTGLGIVYESVTEFFTTEKIEIGYAVIVVMIFSALINEIMARLKIFYGKKENSISLLSDGIHSRVDVYSSLIVLAGLFLSKYWVFADSILAIIIGLYIIKESFSLGKEAGDSLLDVSAGQEIEEEIKEISQKQNIEISNLKTQKKGSAVTANLEIKLPKDLKVAEASQLSENLRKELINKIESLQYVSIQITSHEIETNFYQPEFGKSLSWQKERKGPAGSCICSQCGYETPHQAGTPCSELQCLKCKINLKRK